MSVTLNDGGPAFPQTVSAVGNGVRTYWGMSLRDYFAGEAMKGLLANNATYMRGSYDACAECSVQHADALIKALKPKPCDCSETQSG